ncbi:MAG: FxsA family protein [Planctomycetota bacterium]|jgi:UPF0716 family protein affecting phage T7 exclusion|nr:FxsA family protein [Planctomycetota bacterium]
MAKGFGCLIFLLIFALLAAELWLVMALATWITPDNPEYLGFALAVVVMSVAGYQLVRWRLRRLPMAVMGGSPGPAAVGIFGAVLIVIPGFASGVAGLLLQLPPIQKLFGAFAAKVLMAQAQRMVGKMGAGGMPGGFPGGFPGGGPGGMPGGFPGGMPKGFPGGMPGGFPGMQPDSRARGGKVVDTTGERVDKDKS